MRHATTDDLVALDDVLTTLRRSKTLVERRPGVFYRHGRAFCHFHADPAGLFVDVRVTDRFERMRVSTVRERREFLRAVKNAVSP